MILANSLTLALFDYGDRTSATAFNRNLNVVETVFTGIYLVEAVIKILAMGFVVHKKSYLRDLWNLLDFAILLTGYSYKN